MTFFLKRFILPLMNLALIVGFIGSVHAVDFTVYTDKTAFLAALSPGYYTETFSTLAVNTLLSSPIVLNTGTNQFEVSTGSGDFFNAANGTDVWLSTDIRSESVNFSAFANSPTAIGGYFFSHQYQWIPDHRHNQCKPQFRCRHFFHYDRFIHQFHWLCFHQQYPTLIALVDHIGHHLVGHSQRRDCRESLASP